MTASLAPFSLEAACTTVFERAQPASTASPSSPRVTGSRTVRALAISSASSRIYAAAADGAFAAFGTGGAASSIQLEHESPTSIAPSRRPIDRISTIDAVGKLVVLSEGTLTFHAMPGLQVVDPGAAGPMIGSAVKNVVTFAIDESMTGKNGVNIAIVKRTRGAEPTVGLYRVQATTVTVVREELPLPTVPIVAVLRGQYFCFGDAHTYSLVDFGTSDLIPDLLVVSQDAPTPDGPINKHHRPAIAAVGRTEFLVASHSGATTLGVFVRADTGDPCRGTVQWPSSVRSLAIDCGATVEDGFVMALLRNDTIEVHPLADTTKLAQTIELGDWADPRALVSAHSASGVQLPTLSADAAALTVVRLPLLPPETLVELAPDGRSARAVAEPKTPPSRRTAFKPPPAPGVMTVRTLLQCRNAVAAVAPRTAFAQAEHLLATGKPAAALSLCEDPDRSMSTDAVRYVRLKCAFLYALDTHFDDAAQCFILAEADPRLVIRLWPDLRGSLIGREVDDEIAMFAGLEPLLRECDRGVQSIVSADLYRNYSPHLDVENAEVASDLRAVLQAKARQMALAVLQDWRSRRVERRGRGSRRLAQTVDTALAKLLVEAGEEDAMLALAAIEDSDVVLADLAPWLLERSLDGALAKVFLSRGRVDEVVELWIRLYESAESADAAPASLAQIAEMVADVKDRELRIRHSLWLLSKDRTVGLNALATVPVASPDQLRAILGRLAEVDRDAEDEFLERAVLLGQTEERDLHTDLASRLLASLSRQLRDPTALAALRALDASFAQTPRATSYVDHLLGPDPLPPIVRTRLKLMALLHTSSVYDLPKLREGVERLVELSFERAIIYGKLGLDRLALATLAITLGDFASAELYCVQRGETISVRSLTALGKALDLPIAASRQPDPTSKSTSRDLTKLLIEICLDHRDALQDDHLSELVNAQAVHLEVLHTLDCLPEAWTLRSVTPFLERSCRRTTHTRQSTQIYKALANGENLVVGEQLWDIQRARGPTAAKASDLVAPTDDKRRDRLAIEKLAEKATDVLLGDDGDASLR